LGTELQPAVIQQKTNVDSCEDKIGDCQEDTIYLSMVIVDESHNKISGQGGFISMLRTQIKAQLAAKEAPMRWLLLYGSAGRPVALIR